MLKKCCAALLALLLLCPLVLAEEGDGILRMGDKGKPVREMQQMLFSLGFLRQKPDGKYGKKTETAASAFRQWSGSASPAEQITPEDLAFLTDVCALAAGESEPVIDEEELSRIPGCIPGEGGSVFCPRHQLSRRCMSLFEIEGTPLKLQRTLLTRAIALWQKDIPALYDEWAASAPTLAVTQKEMYLSALAGQQKEWKARGKKLKKGSEAEIVLLAEQAVWLGDIGVSLCFDLHAAEGSAE